MATGSIDELRTRVAAARARGERIGFVPTMGFLHEGHLRLIDVARAGADYVVLSIFVNPLQFGPAEDFSRYPRDEAGDLEKATGRGANLVFVPSLEAMYPTAPRIAVVPVALHERWEGSMRPGHFQGVLTVVTKLLNLVTPDVAILGQKDIQQAALVRALVRDLDIPVEIVVAPTVREPDGLAMSSRNAYLSPEARASARVISAALFAVAGAWKGGEREAARLERIGREVLARDAAVVVDYLALADPERLEPVDRAETGTIAMIAARIAPGGTRLIDNVVLGAE
ncbi:MAG TPA: pantoate--beta-alanine ligase [Gemmatimonadaceae bacterium]|nr:pantoate--beta-alanine ligase [Gemmatimonadaceae bacterium]